MLHAAEDQRARSLAGVPTDDVLARTHAALRTTRRRRTALAVTGAAAAVAVALAGVLTWQPQGAVQPAGPEPTTSTVEVPGVGVLRPATEEEVRGAPAGSALVLWQRDTYGEVQGDPADPPRARTDGDAWFLLLRPDGTVLQVAPAPQGMDVLVAWDRASATVHMADTRDGAVGSAAVDLLTGRVLSAQDDAPWPRPTSPDGTREAYVLADENGMHLAVQPVGGDAVLHPLPAPSCSSAVWVDDARLMTLCEPAAASTPEELVLLDAASGAVLDRRELSPDDGTSDYLPARLADGTVVLPTRLREGDACRTRLDRLDGLDRVTLAEVPVGLLFGRAVVGTGDRVLVAGTPSCTESPSAGVWAVDAATGDVAEVLPVTSYPDGPVGLVEWIG